MLRPAFLCFVLAVAGVSGARAQGCEEAYYRRNVIYKDAGYCFRTPRAIRMFGNAGCRYDSVDEVPLSPRQRAAVADIQAFEQAHRCPR